MTYLAHQGPLDSQLPPSHTQPQSLPHLETPPQHLPSIPTPLSPGHVNQQCVHLHLDPRPHLTPKTIRVLGSVAVDTRFRGQANRETGRSAVHQEEDRPREPTLQEALLEILGAYQHSQDTMGQILDNVQEKRRLQERQYHRISEDLQAINNNLISIAGVLADMVNIMRVSVSHQRAPATSQSSEQPSTSAAASGQEAPPQDSQATSAPPPAEGEPPRKRSLRSRQKPETLAKTPTRK
ncbi:hypothetical protein NDU88_001518 [Pleurodeles waltl]|uniref:Uncharacterized protein n=1 Tax=Pleurodeles waltl TaxID=8319 RepID=A0AAV7SCH4_PLEWA|nr:hypothetical protein NDU88_001518 [Pleurodeles waltl]